MRKFIQDLITLISLGDIQLNKTSYSDSVIPSGESTTAEYWIVRTQAGAALAYIRVAPWPCRSTLVDKATNVRTMLSHREYRSIRNALLTREQPYALSAKLENMIQKRQEQMLAEGRKLADQVNMPVGRLKESNRD